MFVRMITYDSDYGDAITFDEHAFAVSTCDDFKADLLERLDELIECGTLSIDKESGFGNLVDPHTGKAAETYVVAYPSEQDTKNYVNGIAFAFGLFYYPETGEISNVYDESSFWNHLIELDDHVIKAWGLCDILENQPLELDGNSPEGPLAEWDLTEFLFELLQSRLEK
jgi:hypothetical protein